MERSWSLPKRKTVFPDTGHGEISFTPEAACVAGTAAMLLRETFENEIRISIGDNTFQVKWNRWSENVYLSGPAELLKI